MNKNIPEMTPGFLAKFLFLKYNKIKNNIKPSDNASYSWDGCLYKLSIWINFTAQGRFDSTPYNSELIKFAILPKKIPTGATIEIRSKYSKVFWLFFLKTKYLQL